MVKLISAILSLTMLFGSGAAPASTQVTATVPIAVGAQQAVYEKYKDDTIYTNTIIKSNKTEMYWYYQGNGPSGTRGDANWYKEYELYTDYELKPSGINLSGTKIANPICVTHDVDSPPAKYVYYKDTDGNMWSVEHIVSIRRNGSSTVREEAMTKTLLTRKTTPKRGDFIELVTVTNQTFPMNGVSDDGYWYVFKNLVEE